MCVLEGWNNCVTAHASQAFQAYNAARRHCMESKLGLKTIGSNDMSASKLYTILVCYYDNLSQKTVTVFLGLRECIISSTGKNSFLEIDAELISHGLSRNQILAFSTDNVAVMVGQRNGAATFIREQNPN